MTRTHTWTLSSGGTRTVIQEECPRCHDERHLGRCDTPGPWEGKYICNFCNVKLKVAWHEAEIEKRRQKRAAMTPEERKAQARKDVEELYGPGAGQ